MKDTIYKVRLWSSNIAKYTFIFIGKIPTDDIKNIFDKFEENALYKPKITETKLLDKFFDNSSSWKDIVKDFTKKDNVKFLNYSINDDDNVNIVLKKILVYLNKYLPSIKRTEDLYLWINKSITRNYVTDLALINNCFKKDNKLRLDYFQKCVKNYYNEELEIIQSTDVSTNVSKDVSKDVLIDKHDAIKMLSKLNKTVTVSEPILFKYVYEGFFEPINYNPLTVTDNNDFIKSFAINSLASLTIGSFINQGEINTLELITTDNFKKDSDLLDLYFPYSKKKTQDSYSNVESFIKQLDTIENEINKYAYTHTYKSDSYVTFLQVRGNEFNFNKKVNLSILFEKLHTDTNLGFIKYKTNNNVFYKIDKDSLLKIPKKNLEKWTFYKATYASTGKYVNSNFITLKFYYGVKSFCTVTISDTLSIDIKFNTGIDEKNTLKRVDTFIKNTINPFITNNLQKTYPDSLVPELSIDSIKILNLVTYNVIGLEKKTVKFDNISEIVTSKMYPYFSIIQNPDKNILHLQYKKVDNYVKYDNIQNFITFNFGLPKDVLVAKLMETFVMSKDESEKEYEKWSSKNDVEFMNLGDVTKIKPKNDNFVNIKLKVNEIIDTKFIITGLKDFRTQDRIMSLIQTLLDMTNQKVIQKKIDIKDFDKQMFEIDTKKEEAVKFSDIKESLESELDFDAQENEENEDDFDPDFLALEMEFNAKDKSIQEDNTPQKIEKQDKESTLEKETKESSQVKKGKTPGPVLGILKEADKNLFEYDVPKGKKRTDFPSLCGWTDTRQPMVISASEKEKIDKEFPKAYDGFVHTGSTKEIANKNFYICPKIWCPKSRVALSYEDYTKLGNKCPYPEIDEEPVLFNKSYWGKDDEKALTRPHYVGFLKDSTHPNHLCLPCCFKLPTSDKKSKQQQCVSNFNSEKKVEQSAKDKQDVIGNEKYIKGENYFPLEPSRYGLLPKELNDLLGGSKCGSRHDGTGLMETNASCYLRKGISHSNHSFVSCILNIISKDLPNTIKTPQDYIKYIANTITIDKYLALENGKIIRMFINSSFDIHVQENYKEFSEWFLKQSYYIKNFRLYPIEQDIKKNKFFDKKNMSTFKSVIREFMIYNSFKHFILYLNDDSIPKDHKTLLDLINIEIQYLNPSRIHFIVIEVDPKTNKSVILCPFNRHVKDFIDINNPFAFIIKNNEYYEPLCAVKFIGDISSSSDLLYNESSSQIQHIINIYKNNCGVQDNNTKTGESISLYLESQGYKTKHYVLDFGFRIRGILLTNNLYIPFKEKLDVFRVANKSFVYFNHIVDFKCLLKEKQIRDIFKSLQKYTSDEYYSIKEFLYDEEDDMYTGLVLHNNTIVPLHTNKYHVTYHIFENDLEIFIQHQVEDKRAKLMKVIKENTIAFDVFFQSVLTYMNNNENIKKEIEFLMNKNNPFPKNYKRKRLIHILNKISKEVIISAKNTKEADVIDSVCNSSKADCIYPCDVTNQSSWNKCLLGIPDEYMKKFTGRMIETLLLGRFTSSTATKIFLPSANEVLLDQHDINNNKIEELVEHQANPFKLLSERLEDMTDSLFISDKVLPDPKLLTRLYIKDDSKFTTVPVIWRKILKEFDTLDNNGFNSMMLYSIFLNLNEVVNPRKEIDLTMMKSIIKTRIIHDYSQNEPALKDLFENESFKVCIKSLHKITKLLTKPNIDICLDVVDSINYVPSFYELKILTDIVGINVVIIGRKTTSNPDGIEVYDSKSPFTVIFLHSYDRVNKHDKFEFFVKNRKTILFRKKDLPEDFIRITENKKKIFVIDIEEPNSK